MSDHSRQRLRTIITIVATALIIAPAAALATHGFNDVDDGDFFHAAVDWMKDNDVTVGCNPPDNTRYCPHDPVTRGEMAVFLERLDSENVFVRPGDDAVDGGNADTVDGMHASDFLGANAKADNADKLDGKDSTDFLAATGQIRLSVLNYRSHIEDNLNARLLNNGFQVQPGATDTGFMLAYPSITQTMFGAPLELLAWEYCYTTLGSTLQNARVRVSTGDASGTTSSGHEFDSTNRTDDACRTLTFDSPVSITDSSFVSLEFQLDLTGGNFNINRSVLIFQAA